MRKNRLLLYLILFLSFVIVMAIYGKSRTDTYTPEMKDKYTNGIRVGIENMLQKVPLDVVEEKRELTAKEMDLLIGGIDSVFSNYIELKEIGLEYNFYDIAETKTEDILAHVTTSFYDKTDNRISQTQLESYKQLYMYLYDIHQLDMNSLEIRELLHEMEKVSVKYEKLENESF